MLDIYGKPMMRTGQAVVAFGLAGVAKVLPDGYVRFGATRGERPTCDMCGPFAGREQRWMGLAAEWRCRACDNE
jgi:hypothetical protein